MPLAQVASGLVLLPVLLLAPAKAKSSHAELIQAAKSGSCEARGKALISLDASTRKADPELATILRQGLQAGDPCGELRFVAGAYFEKFPEPNLYPALLEALQAALPLQSRDVEHNLARALGATRDPRAFAVLHGIFADPEWHRFVRAGAVVGMALSRDARAVPLLEKLIQDEDPLEHAAVEGLGLVQSRHSVPLLEQALDAPRLVDEAAEALGRIGDPQAVPSLLHFLFVPDLRSRGELVDALATFSHPRVSATFRFLACYAGRWETRFTARSYLEKRGEEIECEPETRGWFSRLLQGPRSSPLREGSTLTPENAGAIAERLSDPEETVRMLAMVDLAALHQPSTVGALEAALARAQSATDRKWLQYTLDQAKAGEAGFRTRLHAPDPMTRGRATFQLIAINGPERDALLVGQLKDADPQVRWEVLDAAEDMDSICRSKWMPAFRAGRKLSTQPKEQRKYDRILRICAGIDDR